jgi:hypothetical protein
MIADDLVLIGRQVQTSYNSYLDLLGIDLDGNLAIIELKRDKTLRDTIAQGIDYAEWCSRLTSEEIVAYGAKRYGSDEMFRKVVSETLGGPFPELLNQKQRILVVAPEIPDHTTRVIQYLASTYGMPINGVSFDVFNLNGTQVVVRHTAIEDEAVLPPPPPGAQKRRTLDEFIAAAHDNGVGELFEHLLTMKDIVPLSERFYQSFAMKEKAPDKRVLAAFTMYPTAETDPHQLRLLMSPSNLSALYGVPPETAQAFIQSVQQVGAPEKGWTDWIATSFTTLEQVEQFDSRFRRFVAGAAPQAGASE